MQEDKENCTTSGFFGEDCSRPTLQFDYDNPNPPAYKYAPGPSLDVDWSDGVVFDAIRARHEDETLNRVRWCLDHGFYPAHNHIHLAPGDDSRFMVAPWHMDGSVNPCGVPWGRRADLFVPVDRMLMDYSCDRGWECRKCHSWVPTAPRQAMGVEPVDWWWCKHCRDTSKRNEAKKKKPFHANTLVLGASKNTQHSIKHHFKCDGLDA